ncbi:hypothetical protein [Empedobacter sp.]|uniref:hypothetical protein n=1 Tax=Empedobacter sp. TaxID=1927715 RepID=UPI00289D85E7|nr:hypothetical protein [Empedobacter sp.]
MKLEDIIYDKSVLDDYKNKSTNIKNELNSYKNSFSEDKWENKYLNYLINNFDEILTCKFSDLKIHKTEFLKIINLKNDNCNCKDPNCQKCNDNKLKSNFSMILQKKLNYSNSNLREIISKKGLKTCYICNAQYAMLATEEIKQVQNSVRQERDIAKFQIDHYYPKSIYPAFAISLSNLYPICAYCNQIKNDNEYDLSNVNANLKFSLDINSLKKYLWNNQNKLKLILKDDSIGKKKISDVFDLKGIYNNHLDEIEELIERKVKYQESYKKVLVRRFRGLNISSKNIDNRLMLGTYDKNEGFYKRPLSKFIHDINDQLDQL